MSLGQRLLSARCAFAPAFAATGSGRHPAIGQLGVLTEEELLHLLAEDFPGFGIGGVETVMVDQDRHMGLPECIALGGDVVVNSLAELAGKRRLVQTGKSPPDLDAIDHSWRGGGDIRHPSAVFDATLD